VGLAAVALRIPYITHDSDALPGLANRIIAPWARLHAVALPKEVYDYPPEKAVTVGVPHAAAFHPLKAAEVTALRKQLGLDEFKKVVLVTGGGLGAQKINSAVVACMPELLARYSDLAVVHVAGRKEEPSLHRRYKEALSVGDQARVMTRGFVTNMSQYSGVADVIITRAGATTIAEFAAQAKACIVVPNPILTGGHQLKNAKVWAARKVVRMVNEVDLKDDPLVLMAPLVDLLDHPQMARELGEKLHELARPDAAHRIAMLLLDIAGA
jgi:UDP-N-acetylglucosamine--N-acetylmuramyl-(pentapeptide) pyrophosphoryl-undecaprenol N-acetylglucosamine transferase